VDYVRFSFSKHEKEYQHREYHFRFGVHHGAFSHHHDENSHGKRGVNVSNFTGRGSVAWSLDTDRV
jgi:hypothetical protein